MVEFSLIAVKDFIKKHTFLVVNMADLHVQYYPNRDGECFLSSLANALIVQFDDLECANRVYREGREHPFVADNGGTLAILWPYLCLELTDNKYTGQMYCDEKFVLGSEKLAKKAYCLKQLHEYKRIVCEYVSSGKIIFSTGYDGPDPVILSLEGLVVGHAVVALNTKSIIDNGIMRNVSLEGIEIAGVLRLEKNISF